MGKPYQDLPHYHQITSLPEADNAEREELENAKKLWQSLIPEAFPQDTAFEIETFFEPSGAVGGDFYDYYIIDEHRLAIIIGDVSGKGLPAAAHMAEVKDIFQSLHKSHLEPQEMIFQANKAVSSCFEKNIFVSLIYLIIDSKKNSFIYIRAGHCPLLFFNSATMEATYLKDAGLGLGIIRQDSFEQHIFVYEKNYCAGDVLLLFTDGLDEGRDPDGKSFGHAGVKNSLEKAMKNRIQHIPSLVIGDFKEHVKDNNDLDDLAMIAVKFK